MSVEISPVGSRLQTSRAYDKSFSLSDVCRCPRDLGDAAAIRHDMTEQLPGAEQYGGNGSSL